jgi:hypothetical protein
MLTILWPEVLPQEVTDVPEGVCALLKEQMSK